MLKLSTWIRTWTSEVLLSEDYHGVEFNSVLPGIFGFCSCMSIEPDRVALGGVDVSIFRNDSGPGRLMFRTDSRMIWRIVFRNAFLNSAVLKKHSFFYELRSNRTVFFTQLFLFKLKVSIVSRRNEFTNVFVVVKNVLASYFYKSFLAEAW